MSLIDRSFRTQCIRVGMFLMIRVFAGDRFRSVIDDAWWCGKIVSRNKNAQSPFLCYKILWDNNENENLSPWDLEPLNSRSEFSLRYFVKFL